MCVLPLTGAAQAWRNTSLPEHERVTDLVNRLTIEE